MLQDYHTISKNHVAFLHIAHLIEFPPTLPPLLHLPEIYIRLEPKKIAYPPVDLLSLGHPAQSASEKALTVVEGDLHILSHVPSLP